MEKRMNGLTVVKWQRQFDVPAEMCLYRARTEAMLRRYCTLSVELGRVPSLLGREFFRSRVTSYRMHNFEDVVIFVYDMERCLDKLDDASRQLIARVALQEYTYEEAARIMGYSSRSIERKYPEAVDRLSSILLEAGMLRETTAFGRAERGVPKKTVGRVEACQEVKKAVSVLIR